MIRKGLEFIFGMLMFAVKDEIIGLIFLTALILLVFCDFAEWWMTEELNKKNDYYTEDR